MSLFLYEATLSEPSQANAEAVISAIDTAASASNATLIESQVTEGASQVFAIVEQDGDVCTVQGLDAASVPGVDSLAGPDQVRLVGADLEQIKAAKPAAGYLVEWDIPDGIDMDTYLARKKEKSPKYAEVPEVSFLRTYVREDMDKCLCFYDAANEADVVHAREVVETPIDRLHKLA